MENTAVPFSSIIPHKAPVLKHLVLFFLVAAVLLAMVLALIWNTFQLNAVLRRSAEGYVEDMAYQMAANISDRLQAGSRDLQQMADSLSEMSQMPAAPEYFSAKAATLGFDAIGMVARDGTAIPADFDGGPFAAWYTDGVGEDAQIDLADGHQILFSAPVVRGGATEALLIGVLGREEMQGVLQSAGFGGNGMSCIADHEGNVVVAATDAKPFLRMNDIIAQGTDQEEIGAIHKMTSDLAERRSGLVYFTSSQNQPLMMSYHFLGVKNWVLLTIVPQDFITQGGYAYLRRNFLIILGIALAFLLILAYAVGTGRHNREQLAKAAFADPVTGGINQAAFQIKCRQLLERQPASAYALIFINVAGFKHINENFGTEVGNKVLGYLYTVLERHLKSGEIAARGETDHFFLCLRENSERQIRARLQAVAAEAAAFPQKEKLACTVELTMGVYLIDDPSLDVKIMQGRAREACGHQTGAGNCAFYNHELQEKVKREMELNALFESSLRRRDFQLHLQPKVRLADNTLGGAEALVRWLHPERGAIYPSDFIPLFEANGKIRTLDLYMFEEVCKLLRRWMAEQRPLTPVSVNLSRLHMRDPGFLQPFVTLKENYQIPDGLIEFEILESVIFDTQQIKIVKAAIRDMHRHGFLCSLDDFGFGYSSLALLQEFDVDAIKLDRQFFAEGLNEKSSKIISSFVRLADDLRISVVAEGIETQEQRAFLRRIGCGMAQGYLYAKPLSVTDFENWADAFAREAAVETKAT